LEKLVKVTQNNIVSEKYLNRFSPICISGHYEQQKVAIDNLF